MLDRKGRLTVGSAEDILQEPLLRDIYQSDLHILYLEELGRKVCVAGSLK